MGRRDTLDRLRQLAEAEPWARPEGAVATVRAGLASRDAEELRLAVDLAAELLEPELVVPLLEHLARAGDAELRVAAACSLGFLLEDLRVDRELGLTAEEEPALDALTVDAAERALRAACDDPSGGDELRRASLVAAARGGFAWSTDAARAAFRSPEASWRCAALKAMAARWGCDDEIVAGLSDPSPEVRLAAAVAVEATDCDAAADRLVELVRDAGEEQALRLGAVRALGCLDDDRVEDVLLELIAGGDEELGEAAHEALDERGYFDDGDGEDEHNECAYCRAELDLELAPPGETSRLVVVRDGRHESLELAFTSCPSPVCPCGELEITLVAPDAGVPPRSVTVDVREREMLDPEAATWDEALSFHLGAMLTPADWATLLEHVRAAKEHSLATVDLATCDVTFPLQTVADGAMVVYSDFFWWSKEIAFESDGAVVLVDDYHCVMPRCRCRDVVLAMYPAPASGTSEQADGAVPQVDQLAAIRLDLENGAWEAEDEPLVASGVAHRLMADLAVARPTLLAELSERRRRLRTLARHAHQRRRGHRVGPAAPRVGGNAPCPCGSGKKHKHCCGR